VTSEWAVELLSHSIRVNAVIVAESFTSVYGRKINTFADPENKTKEITDEIPFENRMTTCEEIANTVVFLLSDRSSCTTGQLVFLDGGYTLLDRVL
jgi:L-fucose dehydrogenase